MSQRGAFLTGGWARGGTSEVVRRAHPASGAQWNVQVVRGKVNGKCLWNACKALSLGLLLMVLGAAMATIGYYADHLSIAQEVRGNHTVAVKNESRGFHLNNLSYAGPIVMGVGGFIVVAACVMTFEARDSAAKVVPARLKVSMTGPPAAAGLRTRNGHGSLRTAASQTAANFLPATSSSKRYPPAGGPALADRHALKQSFVHFSRGLALEPTPQARRSRDSLKVQQGSINRSPSAPDLKEHEGPPQAAPQSSRQTLAACALLNPGLLHRHAVSVDETTGNYRSNESLQHAAGSQGSMAMDLHLECPVTLRIRDRRRNPLKRQRKVEEHEAAEGCPRRSSHSCSPRLPGTLPGGGSAQHLASSRRRSSNASECSRASRSRTREVSCHRPRGRLERAISSESRLPATIPGCYHSYEPSRNNSTEQEQQGAASTSDGDIRHKVMVHFSPHQ
ncbi:uncharacterized protein LOC132707461 [Cylas formicarius]|uniref:uncharacterized protein LOC132707461 n=1 Tax=Cylas formicarius TaxID=197179 RepID=UPI00295853B5|nr:uncharacterized protein LOC132707461 [Cylas formicarius]